VRKLLSWGKTFGKLGGSRKNSRQTGANSGISTRHGRLADGVSSVMPPYNRSHSRTPIVIPQKGSFAQESRKKTIHRVYLGHLVGLLRRFVFGVLCFFRLLLFFVAIWPLANWPRFAVSPTEISFFVALPTGVDPQIPCKRALNQGNT